LSRAKSSFGRFGSFSVIRLVREAKTEYKNKFTSQLMDKSITPDKWWRIAKSVCKLNKCNKVSPPIKHEDRIIIHPSEKCDIFNKYFADISNIENMFHNYFFHHLTQNTSKGNRSKVCNFGCSPFIFVHRGYVLAFPNIWKLSTLQ
jgi:hypothetical protein